MAIGDIKTFDFVYAGLKLQINAIDMGGGNVRFEVNCLEGYADINALYWSDGVADGNNFDLGTKKDNGLNMNGSGEDWDGGVKLSSTGLGPQGNAKPTFLQAGESYVMNATLDWNSLDTLGVRATSTSTAGGSIKGVDGDADVTLAPKACVEDAAPVVEGGNAAFTIHLDHAYQYDVTINYTTVAGTAGTSDYNATTGSVTIHAGDLSAIVNVGTVDDALVESTETFTLHLTGATADIPDLPGGPDSVLGVAIQCVDGTGTILDNDVVTPVNRPPDAVDDSTACVSELVGAITGVSGAVLANDTDPDGDTLVVTHVNGTALVNGEASIVLKDAGNEDIGTLVIHGNGTFTFKYTGPYDPEHIEPTFTYTISDGKGGTDTATVTLCLEPLDNPGRGHALSPGGWTNPAHSLADSENLPTGLRDGSITMDDFFNLDDGLVPVTNRTWTVGGNTVQDITLVQALNQTGNPATVPNLSGNENALIRQAATDVANWYDNDGQADFVAAYIYQRAVNDNNNTLADNPYDAASVLLDLKQQVHDAFEGAVGAYGIDTLTNMLDNSHEA